MSDAVSRDRLFTREEYMALNTELSAERKRLSQFAQALGMVSTLAPTMEIDVDNPIQMVEKIVAQVSAEREQNTALAAALERGRREAREEGIRMVPCEWREDLDCIDSGAESRWFCPRCKALAELRKGEE